LKTLNYDFNVACTAIWPTQSSVKLFTAAPLYGLLGHTQQSVLICAMLEYVCVLG